MEIYKFFLALLITIILTACGGGNSSSGGEQSKDLTFCVSVSEEEGDLMKTYTFTNLCNEAVNLSTVLTLGIPTSTETIFISDPFTTLLMTDASIFNKVSTSPNNSLETLATITFIACRPPSFGVISNAEPGNLECN